MVKYMIQTITFVQYMHTKLIKYSIKMRACYYAAAKVLFMFNVYIGRENDVLGSTALNIVERLIKFSGLVQNK